MKRRRLVDGRAPTDAVLASAYRPTAGSVYQTLSRTWSGRTGSGSATAFASPRVMNRRVPSVLDSTRTIHWVTTPFMGSPVIRPERAA